MLFEVSKTERRGFGEWRAVGRSGARACPVRSLAALASSPRAGDAALLSPVPYAVLNGFATALGRAAGVEGVTAHGFRRGAATALASAGVASDAIRLAGRWAPGSFSVWRYADPTMEASTGLAQLMARPYRVAGGAQAQQHTPADSEPTRSADSADGDSCGSA